MPGNNGGKSDMEKLREKARTEPARCWAVMQPEIINYIEGELLTCAYPILSMFTNPQKSMQGGFISAAIDNTVGALIFVETGTQAMASIDLHVNYQRPIFENDILTVTAYLKSMGKNIAHLYAEAYDEKKRLIATATTNIMLLDKRDP